MDWATLTQLGPTGLAIGVFYGIYKLFDAERKRNEERLDKAYEALRALDADIRDRFSTRLQENTNAMGEYSKIMRKVFDLLTKMSGN